MQLNILGVEVEFDEGIEYGYFFLNTMDDPYRILDPDFFQAYNYSPLEEAVKELRQFGEIVASQSRPNFEGPCTPEIPYKRIEEKRPFIRNTVDLVDKILIELGGTSLYGTPEYLAEKE